MQRPELTVGHGRWPPALTGKLAQSLQQGARRVGAGLGTAARRNRPEPAVFVAAPTQRTGAQRQWPPVSIVILNRNGAGLLEEALASLYRVNRYPAVEIILVDHASADDSLAVAEKWARTLPLKIVPCAENHSFSYSCNRAAESAAGEFLLLLNNDVVLIEDVIGHMVAAARQGASAVGLQLFGDAVDRRLNHIGIRFRWNYRYLALQPYNAVASVADRPMAREPAGFPAVTAAALLCRRADYLAVGGLCEDYVYGCEDVDLCLKLRRSSGLPVVCLDGVGALHSEGRTRLGKTPKARRSAWYRHNIAVFERRFGYPVRREATEKLFTDNETYWGRRPIVHGVAPPAARVVRRVWEALAEARGWSLRRAGDGGNYNLAGVDLLLLAAPGYRLAWVRHRGPHMLSAAWLVGDLARWSRHPLAIHDLLLTDSAAGAERLLAERGLRAAVLDPHDPAATDRLFSLIVERLCTGYRVALKLATREQRGFAGELAGWLRREGLRVRLDLPGSWRGRETIRDDVAVLLPGAACPALPGKINLVCGSARRPAADARLPMSRPETLAAAICDAIAECHPRRLAAAFDPPLAPNPDFPRAPGPNASTQRARQLLSGGLPLPA